MYTMLSPRMETRLSPNLVLASQLLQVSGIGLEQLIRCELADNPALELVNDNQYSYADISMDHGLNRSLVRSDPEIQDVAEQIPAWPSAIDQLEAQVRLIASGPELDLAIYVLHSLDERGYLATGLEELAAELGASLEAIEQGLRILHQLDPPGIGARDLRECLLVQCADLGEQGIQCQIVQCILANAWDDFINRRWDRVARRVSLSESEVELAWHFVARNLYPYPLMLVATTSPFQEAFLLPDLIILCQLQDDQAFYQLDLPAADVWELKISECFAAASGPAPGDEPDLVDAGKAWIRAHVERARLFIHAINHRWDTLRRIGEYLIGYQVEFLNHGTSQLRPLRRTTIAQELGLHESTISRAVSGKFVQLPNGSVMPLNDFFDASLPAKQAIEELLAHSSELLSDREIAECLRSEGITLARRTVAKYRRQLNLQPSYSRKQERRPSLQRGGRKSNEDRGEVAAGMASHLLPQR